MSEVLYNILIDDTYSKVRIGKHVSESLPIQNVKKTRRCSITSAFQLCIIICD
jgi:hypothetical protein